MQVFELNIRSYELSVCNDEKHDLDERFLEMCFCISLKLRIPKISLTIVKVHECRKPLV